MLSPKRKRRFTSTDGTVWTAEVRTVADIVLAFRASDTDTFAERTFLYFHSWRERRRVETFPVAWTGLPDAELEALLLTAHVAPK